MSSLSSPFSSGPELRELDHLPDGFLDATARNLHEVLPDSTLIHLAGARTAPIFVSVLLHGNEDVGLRSMQRVLAKYGQEPLPRALSLFVGNIEAARAGVRRLDHQPDYNRIWGTAEPRTAQERMAARVVATMRERGVTMAVDLHNNSGRNPLYTCINSTEEPHLRLARAFSPLAVLIESQPSLGAAFTPICPTITCECGEIGNAEGIAQAAALVERCLAGELDEAARVARSPLDIFEAFAVMKIPQSLSFSSSGAAADIQLQPDIEALNFRALLAGQVLATAAPHLATDPLQAFELTGKAIDGLFVRKGTEVCLSVDAVAAMLTRDERAIRQDCLGYLMKRVAGHA